jgi:hypothetical protein
MLAKLVWTKILGLYEFLIVKIKLLKYFQLNFNCQYILYLFVCISTRNLCPFMCKICNNLTNIVKDISSTTKASKFMDEPVNFKPLGEFKTATTTTTAAAATAIKLTVTKSLARQTTIIRDLLPKLTSAATTSIASFTLSKLSTKIIGESQSKTSIVATDSTRLNNKLTTALIVAASSTKPEASLTEKSTPIIEQESNKSNRPMTTESNAEFTRTDNTKNEEFSGVITLGHETTKTIETDSGTTTTSTNSANEDSMKTNEPTTTIESKLEQTTQQADEVSSSGGVCNTLECENLGIFNAQTCQCDCMSGYSGSTCDKFDCNSPHLDPTECASLIESDSNACSDQSTKSFCPKTCLCSAN